MSDTAVPKLPSYIDGRSGLGNVLLQCLNLAGDGTTYLRLAYQGDNIKATGVTKRHTNNDEEPLGSTTFTGFEEGSITYKMNKVTHPDLKPAYTLELNKNDGRGSRFYKVEDPGPTWEKGNQVTGSVSVSRLYNPVILTLLSAELGQHRKMTHQAGSAFELELEAINVREGGEVSWSLEDAPDGMVIDEDTGELEWAAPVAGRYAVKVNCVDHIDNTEDCEVQALLILTVTPAP